MTRFPEVESQREEQCHVILKPARPHPLLLTSQELAFFSGKWESQTRQPFSGPFWVRKFDILNNLIVEFVQNSLSRETRRGKDVHGFESIVLFFSRCQPFRIQSATEPYDTCTNGVQGRPCLLNKPSWYLCFQNTTKEERKKLWEDITSSQKSREAKTVWKAKDLSDSDFFFKMSFF